MAAIRTFDREWFIQDLAQPDGMWRVREKDVGISINREWIPESKLPTDPRPWEASRLMADATFEAFDAMQEGNFKKTQRQLRRLMVGISVVKGHKAIEEAKQILDQGFVEAGDDHAMTIGTTPQTPHTLFNEVLAWAPFNVGQPSKDSGIGPVRVTTVYHLMQVYGHVPGGEDMENGFNH